MADESNTSPEKEARLRATKAYIAACSSTGSCDPGCAKAPLPQREECPEKDGRTGPKRGRSAQIYELVEQLRRGEINKTELFTKLQQLQGPTSRGERGRISHPEQQHQSFAEYGSEQAVPVSPEDTAQMTSVEGETAHPAVFFTTHDRQAIIKQIADERRRRAQDVRQSWPGRLDDSQSVDVMDSPSRDDGDFGGRWDSDAADRSSEEAPPPLPPPPPRASSTTVSRGGNDCVGCTRLAWGTPTCPMSARSRGRNLAEDVSCSTKDHGIDDGRGDATMHHHLSSTQADTRQAQCETTGRDPSADVDENVDVTPVQSNVNQELRDPPVTVSHGTICQRRPRSWYRSIGSDEPPSYLQERLAPRPHARGRANLRERSGAMSNGSRGERLSQEQNLQWTRREGMDRPACTNADVWGEDGEPHDGGKQNAPWLTEGEARIDNGRGVYEEACRFRSFSEERARRGEEIIRRELMSECTFRPKIKGLPQSYGGTKHDKAPFLERVTQWKRDKEKDAAARKAEEQAKELEACTFTPHVNRASRRAALSRREALGEQHIAVDERLYDEHIKRDMDRSHLKAEQAAMEEERLRQECTFKPELTVVHHAASAGAQHATAGIDESGRGSPCLKRRGLVAPRARSRYRQAAAAIATSAAAAGNGSSGGGESGEGGGGGSGWGIWGAGRRFSMPEEGESRDWGLDGCTFSPAVIGARKGMYQAQRYLQLDVVDRLTGAAFLQSVDDKSGGREESPPRDSVGRDIGSARASGAATGGESGWKRWASAGRSADQYKSRAEDQLQEGEQEQQREEMGEEADKEREEAMDKFHAFLSRQNRSETEKLKHIQAFEETRTPTFRPAICSESVRIHMESNKGSFLQRVARDAARKEHEAVRKQAAGSHDPDCTFKPQITARSSSLPVRSVVELSRGDQLKRETTLRLTKLRTEQELLADTTFHPRITELASRMADSRLKVVSDPESYAAMVEVRHALQCPVIC